MPAVVEPPSAAELEGVLGSAAAVWDRLVEQVRSTYPPLTETWKPSRAEFGRMCLLQHRKRTLVYLTPERGIVRVAVVLGEHAVALATASALPDEIKAMLAEAKPYAEGRGIRFAVDSVDDLGSIATLLEMKTARS